MIDMRCTATMPGLISSREVGRCQLLAGHEGAHAVMFARSGGRCLRRWRDSDPQTIRDDDALQPNLPWVHGMPLPAWQTPA